MEVHGTEVCTEPPWTSIEVRGGSMELHRVLWRSPQRLMELHRGLHGAPWSSMELRGGLHGVPNNVGHRKAEMNGFT